MSAKRHARNLTPAGAEFGHYPFDDPTQRFYTHALLTGVADGIFPSAGRVRPLGRAELPRIASRLRGNALFQRGENLLLGTETDCVHRYHRHVDQTHQRQRPPSTVRITDDYLPSGLGCSLESKT